jgi:hypothetical protein
METNKSKYHPVPAVRSSGVKQTNGMQKLYSKIINKIEDLPPKLHTKLQPKSCNLVRSLPFNRPISKVKTPASHHSQLEVKKTESMILSDDDEFYSKLTFDDSEQSLEDSIFQELEKVSHDEIKLNAALQNFDRILLEHNDKKSKEAKAIQTRREEKPSAIPKPLQKSKTCSIIESKCILKKQNEKKKMVEAKVEKPIHAENFGPINYYQVTKSLWNLQDFDEFAKSAQKIQLGPRKSEGAIPSSSILRAKSVWDMPLSTSLSRPSYSRQSSISKIPIKSSKLSTSMMQLNASTTTLNSYCNPSPSRLSKSSVYASALSLTSPPSKLLAARRSSLGVNSKKNESASPKAISRYVETKTSLQRRNMVSSTNSINRVSISIAPSRPLPPLKSAKSEMSLHVKLQLPSSKQKVGTIDPVHRSVPSKEKRDSDSLLDKCLVKGQELLRKVEEFNDANRVHDDAKIVASDDIGKRDYIAKDQSAASTKASAIVRMNTKSSSEIVNSIETTNETSVNAITNHCVNVDNQTGNPNQTESEKKSPVSKLSLVKTARIVTVEVPSSSPPTLESCEIIPVVLDAQQTNKVDGDTVKDYSSDCSDDSGHISNENEDLTLKMKPRKISEDLLEIFEKKPSKENKKVIELNHVNLIKTSLEIYPTLNKTCKSEVTFFINRY